MSLRSFITSILCCIATTLFAHAEIDSLWLVVEETKDPIIKVDALNRIAYLMRSTNPDSTILIASRSESLAEESGYQLGIGDSRMRRAIAHTNLGNFYRSLQLYLEAQSIFEEFDAKDRIASCINNVGRLYNFLGEHDRALEYYNMAATQFSELKDPREGNILNNIGYIHKIRGEYSLALDYLRRALISANESKDLSRILFPIYNIGSVYVKANQMDSASYYLDSAINLSTQLRNQYILGLAKIDKGLLFLKLNQIDNAENLFKEAYDVAVSSGMRSEQRDAARYLADTYEQQGKLNKALQFHKTYKATDDSLINRDLARRIAFQEAEYEYNRKQVELEIEMQKENLKQESELKSAIWIRNTLIVSFMVLSLITYILYRNFKRKRKDHEALQTLNKQIKQQAGELQNANHEIIVMNNNLEKIVNQRTEQLKLRNKQLKEYLSNNSHIVRAPLARILGLVDLYDPEDSANLPFINESLQDSANELDNALRSINEKLSDEQEG